MGKRTISEVEISSVSTEPSMLVSTFFTGFQPPSNSSFKAYKSKNSPENYLLHGESDTLTYDGGADNDDNNYYVAVYDKVSNSAELFAVPVIETKVVSKKKAVYSGPSIRSKDKLRVAQRNALGQEFGTRRAKKSIKSYSQNKIEADKLEHNESQILDKVEESAASLPSMADINSGADIQRPTPVANVDANNVEDIYTISSIVPKGEWASIRVDLLGESKDKIEFFPYKHSKYVVDHLEKNLSPKKLKLLYYASLLLGVFHARRTARDKLSLTDKLNTPPEVLVDGVLSRFTSLQGSGFKSKQKKFVIDPFNEDKLVCFLLAVILHIDNFLVLVPPLAQELSMKPSKLVSLFRALGCTVKNITLTQAEAFGIPRSSASSYKVASLKVPFKEAVMIRRGRRN